MLVKLAWLAICGLGDAAVIVQTAARHSTAATLGAAAGMLALNLVATLGATAVVGYMENG